MGTCECGREITGRQRKRCALCAAADPHRHTGRSRRVPEIIVSVDCEGIQTGDHMAMVSVSYGREDGTSATLSDPGGIAGPVALRWLIDELSGHYTAPDGTEYRQAVTSFHFTWDASVIARDFTGDMMLVHKATARHRGLLCATRDCAGECGKLHRYDPATIQEVISDGGEESLIAWHRASEIGLAISPRRRLYAEHRPEGDRMEDRRVLDVHDTGSAFVGGLLDVIDKWKPELTPDQLEAIAWGKKARAGGFLHGTPEQIESYSEAECVAHARCVRLLLDSIKDAAKLIMKPSTLFGSGSVAAAAMKFHRVPTRTETHVDTKVIAGTAIDDVARLDYFGGLINTPVLGMVAGLVDEVDLNSAYPAQAIKLPCMKTGHGSWMRRRGERGTEAPAGAVGHVLATWDVETPSTGPFVVRTTDGLVRDPLSGYRVWVTLPEFQAAAERFGPSVIAHETLWWDCTCDCGNPLAWLEDLYLYRQDVKAEMAAVRDTDPDRWQYLKCIEEAVKLIINSCYGKLAQQRPQLGKYTNLHFAGFITGSTRAEVRRESWRREDQGGTVVYTHTDSVLSQGGAPVDGGPALGAWGLEKQSENLLIVQPGLAVALGGGKIASRGCRRDEFSVAARAWASDVDLTTHPTTWPPMKIERTMMISRRMAEHRGKPHTAGAFLPQPLTINFTSGKRDIANAIPMPGCPTAWIIPPIRYVPNPGGLEDLKQYQTRLAARIAAGDFDRVVATPTFDELDNSP